jgi:hypothetical protein
MKTAIQILKDRFMEAGTLADWMDNAFDEAIEKQKQQIINAYDSGQLDWDGELYETSEDYYNKIFNNGKEEKEKD